jgi:hypothetical protein
MYYSWGAISDGKGVACVGEEIALLEEQLASAAVLKLKAKAVAQQFEDYCIYRDTAVDSKGLDGLHKLTPSGQQTHLGAGTTPAALSLKQLDAMIDPVKPDFLLMSRRSRGISAFARTLTSPVQFEPATSAGGSCSTTASPSSRATSWSTRSRSRPALFR